MTAGEHRVADADAVSGVVAGVRRELSRAGALRPGEGYPRVVVEVLRVDELPAGIAAVTEAGAGEVRPLARGMAIAVTARAWVVEGPSGAIAVDTGDLRRVTNASSQPEARLDAVVRSQAIAATAREVGAALARRILGEPEAAVEP